MANLLVKLNTRQLISPPSFLIDNLAYLVQMGSTSYGVAEKDSDIDIYGFCIPPKEVIFPHLTGYIDGFGQRPDKFEQWQQHHVFDPNAKKEYDFSIYNIVKFFDLLMSNNPNIIDSLFVPHRCILYSSQIGNLIREQRKLFLHRGAWFKFKGYAYSQLAKVKNKEPEGKRAKIVEKFGYDVKFAYHIVRLLNEIEMILIEGDLDLERNNEQLKSIRRGEWTLDQVNDYFTKKESDLESVYLNSKLRDRPDQKAIKNLLLSCLEMHYGNLEACIANVDKYVQAVSDIKAIISRLNG